MAGCNDKMKESENALNDNICNRFASVAQG
jgi:hypothetical protein